MDSKAKKLKLVILSVGSLLGQNILHVLNNRRDNFEVVGLNSEATHFPHQINSIYSFLCDISHKVFSHRSNNLWRKDQGLAAPFLE